MLCASVILWRQVQFDSLFAVAEHLAMVRLANAKRIGLCAIAVLFCMGVNAKEKFPPVSQLPVRSELPDPLTLFNGKPVETRKQWFTQRRRELRELFQHYEYGYFPDAERIRSRIEAVDPAMFGGKATLKLVRISFGPRETPDINLMLVVPNQRKGRVPVFVGAHFRGNQTLVTNTIVPLPTAWTPARMGVVLNNRQIEESRGTEVDAWAIEQSIDCGYAVATFYAGDVDPDRPNFRDGVHPFLRSHSQERGQRGPHDWGTIAAWAWGVQRAVDYLERDKDIDSKRIAVAGHSRMGKTALLAGAFDTRIALIVANQAGCGGPAPARSTLGERVKDINSKFPHWFCDEFKKFSDQPEKLPFDQHCLIALCAPRPVLLSNATEDNWANPPGQFEMLKAADPVYRLVGSTGLGASEMPETGRLIDSPLGYHIRPGQHSMTKEDWKVFLDYADKYLAP